MIAILDPATETMPPIVVPEGPVGPTLADANREADAQTWQDPAHPVNRVDVLVNARNSFDDDGYVYSSEMASRAAARGRVAPATGEVAIKLLHPRYHGFTPVADAIYSRAVAYAWFDEQAAPFREKMDSRLAEARVKWASADAAARAQEQAR